MKTFYDLPNYVTVENNLEMEERTMNNFNLNHVLEGGFSGVPMSQADEINNLIKAKKNESKLVMEPGGIIRPKDSVASSSGDNFTEVKAGTFASSHYDQWYERNPLVFKAEVAEMHKEYPDARYGFLESTGDMYWMLKLKMTETGAIKPYNIMLLYEKNHPSSANYGGSVKSILCDPDVSELRERARKAGRNSVPHLLGSEKNGFVYLCTRLPEEIQAGKSNISAVQAAGFCADWILAFELGLQDKYIWNQKFCGSQHRDAWVA